MMIVSKIIKLRPEEQVLLTVRRDFVPYIPSMVLYAVLFVLPFFLMFPLFTLGEIGVVIFVFLIISAVILSFRTWFSWSKTMFVVTDRRLIDVDQRGFFDRTITELFFGSIDDVSYRHRGFLATMCRFGTVIIRTKGEAADIEVQKIRKPARLNDLINDLREVDRENSFKDPKLLKLEEVARELDEGQVEEVARRVKKKTKNQSQQEAMEDFFEDFEEFEIK